jgi:hypothetical protein
MDEEILEAICENYFQHHEQKIEVNCQDAHENFHQGKVLQSYFSSLENDEIL